MQQNNLQITFPLEGELVNHADGAMTSSANLAIQILGKTAPGCTVTLNGNQASATAAPDGSFSLPCSVKKIFNEIRVSASGTEITRRFVYDPDIRKRYNFFIDDNVFFLTELVRKNRKSIFDSFYIAFLRSLHEKYDFKVTLNTFYCNSHDPDHFTTSELPDCYKSEFEENADWLKLAFHAYAEFPDNPYGAAYPEKLPEHHKLLTGEIRRYAGEKSLIEPVLMHWYEIASDASRTYISQQGMNCFALPEEHWTKLAGKYGRNLRAQYNYQFNQLEIPLLFMVNLHEEKILLEKLEHAYAEPGRDFLLTGTHEQYSYPAYFNYIPEHFQRMEAVVKSLHEHGYECVYFTESLLKQQGLS